MSPALSSSSFFDEQAERGESFFDTRLVGDDHDTILFFKRDVVIHADEDAFAMNIEIANSELCHTINDSISPKNGNAENSEQAHGVNVFRERNRLIEAELLALRAAGQSGVFRV